MYGFTEGNYQLGDFTLQSGDVLPDAFLGYATYGSLNDDRDNVVVFPTWYTGTHHGVAPYIAPGNALDPEKYFIVVPDMFTNGYSTSPSNAAASCSGLQFPLVTAYDNVTAQRRMLEEHFQVSNIELMVGFSMSGQQAYHWAALHSDLVRRACSICGTAKTSLHNWAMLHAYKSAMEASSDWTGVASKVWQPEILRLVASIGATMAMSQDWYREGLYIDDETHDVTDVINNISSLFEPWVPANLYAQTLTWMSADVSDNDTYKGNLVTALGSIEIPFLMLPCESDMYFRVEDNEEELMLMPNATMRVIRSKSGHMAGLPGFNSEDDAFIDRSLKDFLGK